MWGLRVEGHGPLSRCGNDTGVNTLYWHAYGGWLMNRSVRPAQVLALVGLALGAMLWPSANPASAASVSSLDVGVAHACVITSQSVQCWGYNSSAQLGSGSISPSSTPAPQLVAPIAGSVTAVAAGYFHTCARTVAGGVKCWGSNSFGRLGDGLVCGTTCLAPVDVFGLTSGVSAIAAGSNHTCALTTGGAVKCWGDNSYGQLGDNGVCGTSCPIPTNVSGLSSGVTAISAGNEHTCARISGGSVRCWGHNDRGQLGDGQVCGTTCKTPVNVTGLQVDVTAISAGRDHTCALVIDEPVIGGGLTPSGLIFQQTIVKCWGFNFFGQLGDGNSGINRTVPVNVCSDSACTDQLVASQVAAGGIHTCALVSGGGVKCWGDNSVAQVGNGTTTGPVTTPPFVPIILSGATQISAGDGSTCARTATGLLCWGRNNFGQTGSGVSEMCGMNECVKTPTVVGDLDSDADGCANSREQGGNAALGGLRNAKQFWDFFDTPTNAGARDKVISTGDLQRIVSRFGSTQSPAPTFSAALTQALGTPAPAGYNAAFDRSAPSPGGDPWDLNGPDGSISAGDILFVLNQFGHSCA